MMQLLPSELKCLIAKLLASNLPEFGTFRSLSALARTHTAFQRGAEILLYHTLYIYADDHDDSLKCIATLASNSEKSALVRSLTVEYMYENTEKNRRVTTYLSKSLVNMHSISDFRIKSPIGGVESQPIKGLGKILW